MKKILIPTDFSKLGDFAYSIASFIAEQIGATLEAIAVIPGPQGAFYSKKGELMNANGNDYSEWHKRLEVSKEKMKNWVVDKKYFSQTSCTIGNIDQAIINYAENNKVDLIVMGTEGLFNKNVWSKGSHTEYVTNHSPIPVLSLKCDRPDLDLKEMVFLGDFLVNDKIDLSIVKSIQAAFGSKLILLKVKTPGHKRSEEQIKDDMQAFAATNELTNYEMNIYDDATVESGLGKYCAEKNIDMIILGTHQGKGFSKLFRRSISDDIVNHLYHPILTFPIHS